VQSKYGRKNPNVIALQNPPSVFPVIDFHGTMCPTGKKTATEKKLQDSGGSATNTPRWVP
jgi:hypothetical protein